MLLVRIGREPFPVLDDDATCVSKYVYVYIYICLCAHIFSLLFVLLMLFFIFLVGQKLCLLFLVFFTQNKSLDTDMFGKEKYIFLLRYNQLLLLTRNFQSIFICISSLQKDYLS